MLMTHDFVFNDSWRYKHFSSLLNFNEHIVFQKLLSSTLFFSPLAVLDLCCCMGFPLISECGGYSLFWVCRLLVAVASLVAEHGPWGAQASVVVTHGLSSWGSQPLEHSLSSWDALASLLWGMWDLLGPGIEPVPPALADRVFTTKPPGKPSSILYH